MSKIAVIRDPLYLRHSNGPGHPESPQRLRAIDRVLERSVFKNRLEDVPARDATVAELARVHTPAYIRSIEKTAGQSFTFLDQDTSTSADSYAAALRAAGGTIQAVDAVLQGGYQGSFALVRPPGHHAEQERAMGFCLFNNVAVAARHALEARGLQRVLIVDWDVHHGNGTMHSFYESNQIIYFSIHQYPHYPGTGRIEEIGRGAGAGYTVNIPLAPGQGDPEYRALFYELLQPIARAFSPQLILISAGFDAQESDPLAGMVLTSRGFGELTAAVMDVAAVCCPGKIALVLEGGYDQKALGESVSWVLRALLGERVEAAAKEQPGSGYITRVITDVISACKPYWNSL